MIMDIKTLVSKLNSISDEVNLELEYANCLFLLAQEFVNDLDDNIQGDFVKAEVIVDLIDYGISRLNYRDIYFYVDFMNSGILNSDLELVLGKEGFNGIEDGLSDNSVFNKKLGKLNVDSISGRFVKIMEKLMPDNRGSASLLADKFINYLLYKYDYVVNDYIKDLISDYRG